MKHYYLFYCTILIQLETFNIYQFLFLDRHKIFNLYFLHEKNCYGYFNNILYDCKRNVCEFKSY